MLTNDDIVKLSKVLATKEDLKDFYKKHEIDAKLNALTNHDLDKIGQMLDNRLDKQFEGKIKPFVKTELSALETNLKDHMDQGIEAVMGGLDGVYEVLSQPNKTMYPR